MATLLVDDDPAPLPNTRVTVVPKAWRGAILPASPREVPEEVAVALTYNGSTQAVMMVTPADLEDFAVGFSLTERIVRSAGDIESLEILPLDGGIEARMWIADDFSTQLSKRRRMMAGPTGCGLCGIESLAEALPTVQPVQSDVRFSPDQLMTALTALTEAQALHRATRAVHAAGFWQPGRGMVIAREDLGRHNAMDKLVGALARNGVAASNGIAVITSRVSVEIVQKAAILGVPVLMAVSAPTALALRTAQEAGITLIAIARTDGFEIFTRPDRVCDMRCR
ncbi:MAG: formate dehydrogenase accessory sulfurtransferase FdhD [Alphaproteobacteria bacterium]|nr:formate dehydrogenase accessory sulfurtransferase FdhD [Alphaproteobacteria bacterium]